MATQTRGVYSSLYTLRNKDAELYIPSKVKKAKSVFAFESLSNGNCWYSSVSLLLAGDNSLVQDLRLLTSIELYLNAAYYTDEHPYFTTVFSRYHGKITSSLMNLFMISLSHESIDEVQVMSRRYAMKVLETPRIKHIQVLYAF